MDKKKKTRLRVMKHRSIRFNVQNFIANRSFIRDLNILYKDLELSRNSSYSFSLGSIIPSQQNIIVSYDKITSENVKDETDYVTCEEVNSTENDQANSVHSNDNYNINSNDSGDDSISNDKRNSSFSDDDNSGENNEYYAGVSDKKKNDLKTEVFSENDIDEPFDVIEELKKWAIISNIKFIHLDALLIILRRNLLPTLPKCSKTFLQSSHAQYQIRPMIGLSPNVVGEFVYLGITENLRLCVNPKLHTEKKLFLQINIDGASPFKSSTKQLWPILCRAIHEANVYHPFPVAIYYGDTKPGSIHSYLREFINEINILHAIGIVIDSSHFSVQLEHIICDSPARAFVKQIKGHGGYGACERCEIKGDNVFCSLNRKSKQVTYPDHKCELRTDESFRAQKQNDHHTGISPLLDIQPQLDMISSFPLDYLHLLCLGITKKFYISDLLFEASSVRLKASERKQLSDRIEYLKLFTPTEFQRKPRRPVTNLKALELRFIALYAGPIVFKNIVSSKIYYHFLLFHVAFRILCTKGMAQTYNANAKSYLEIYFINLPLIFGEQACTLNAHNTIHIADDLRDNNYTLDDISAFPFESYLGILRTFIRTASKPLSQLCRRIHEQKYVMKKPSLPPVLKIINYRKIMYRGLTLADETPNDIILLDDKVIVKITKFHITNDLKDPLFIEEFKWTIKKPIYKYPTNSSIFNMYELQEEPSTHIITCKLSEIESKMVRMEVIEVVNGLLVKKQYVVPLLH